MVVNKYYIESEILKNVSGIKHAFFTKNLKNSTNQYCYKNDVNLENIVDNNRKIAMEMIGREKQDLVILCQTHSNKVLTLKSSIWQEDLAYDAVATNIPKITLGILTADCVPVLFVDQINKVVAAAHAGWRGAFAGIIENTITSMENLGAIRNNITVAIGPCIRQATYEVDDKFYQKFINQNPENRQFFIDSVNLNHFMFDLSGYVKTILTNLHVKGIDDCGINSFTDKRMISYRRCMKEGSSYKSNILSIISLN